MRESTFSFWQDASFNALVDQPLGVADDAWHPEEAWDWWFFEGLLDDGYYVGISFFSADPVAARDSGCPAVGIQVGTQAGDVQAVAEVCGPEEMRASLEFCEVVLGENLARQEGETWRVIVRNGEVGADLTWRPLLPGWKPGRGLIAYGDKGLRTLRWCVPLPRAAVEGEIVLQGRRVPVRGIGYHDHRGGNVSLAEVARHVQFGRLYGDKTTLVFAQWRGPYLFQWSAVPAVYLARGEECILATGTGELVAGDYAVDQASGYSLPGAVNVRAGGRYLLEGRVKAGRVYARQALNQEARSSEVWRLPLATVRQAGARLLFANGGQGEEPLSGSWETLLVH